MTTSIRWRLTTWYVAILALTLAVLGIAVFLLMRHALYDWVDDGLEGHAGLLASQVTVRRGQPILEDQPDEDSTGRDEGYLLLGTGRQVSASAHIEPRYFVDAPVIRRAFSGARAGGTVITGGNQRWRAAAFPVVQGGRVVAVVAAVRSLQDLNEVIARLEAVLLALLPLGLAGAGLGGFAMASRALRPVDDIARAAIEISDRDLSQRLPVHADDELGRLASTFNDLMARLEAAFDRQRRFTADASHELRTPLAVIRAITSQKLMRSRAPEDYERALQQIDQASSYMGKLIGHLLTLARADAGQAHVEPELLDVADLLQFTAAQVGEASDRPIPVTSQGPVMVCGDPVQLTGLFLNLLENAVKYTPADGEIVVTVSVAGSATKVQVSDTGVGIPPEHLPHIFDRFYRVDPARAREQGGTGLGLSIGQWIAEAHGGSIQAESVLGRGTTMTVTLPLAAPVTVP